MKESMFDKNLAALRTGNPETADLVAGAMDAENAEWRPAHGFDGPGLVRELNPESLDILLTLGFGDGTWLQDFADAAPGCSVYVFELYPQRLARALQGTDLTRLFTSGRFHVFTGAQTVNEFGNFFYSSFMDTIMKRIFRQPDKSESIMFEQNILSTESPVELSVYHDLMQQLDSHFQNLKQKNELYAKIRTHGEDLADYLGEDIEEFAPAILDSEQLLADDWKANNPSSKQQIHEWYCKTPNYLLELCAYHAISHTYPVIAGFIEQACTRVGGRILDFGGGDGDMALRLARRGLNIEYCDVPGRTMEFAQWRFKKHGFDIPCIVSDDPDTVRLPGLYDVILCMDVLEHLVNPMHYCEILYQHLRPGGLFFTRPSFSQDDLHPMHLAENVQYHETFDAMMGSIGFRQIPIPGAPSYMIGMWIKAGGG